MIPGQAEGGNEREDFFTGGANAGIPWSFVTYLKNKPVIANGCEEIDMKINVYLLT